MPRDKDLKRLVRTRMKKTGESYTTARTHLVSKSSRSGREQSSRDLHALVDPTTTSGKAAADPKRPHPTAVADYAQVAGWSDATLLEKTGRAWKEWVGIIDRAGGREKTHGERARFVNEQYGVDGWWSQCVTTGYERIAGLRGRGQRMDGSWEANKSKTCAVSVDELFEAWSDAKFRQRWLKDPSAKVRTATAPRSMRLQFPDGTIVAVGFWAKGEGKSSVSVQHTKLPDKESCERMKRYWKERLDALAELLQS
jgi:uncharacterized protein YndB with AHSA1/START domain